MNAERILQIEEMEIYELLDFINELRDVIWSDERPTELLSELRVLIGKPDDIDIDY